MTIYVNIKQLGKRKSRVAATPFDLQTAPGNLRELIGMMVRSSVADFNRRIHEKTEQVLADKDLDFMSQMGRIGFGIPFGNREADPDAAVETAIQGFTDGLFRFFVGDTEIEDLDSPMNLRTGDTITMIRLTMLTGGFFW